VLHNLQGKKEEEGENPDRELLREGESEVLKGTKVFELKGGKGKETSFRKRKSLKEKNKRGLFTLRGGLGRLEKRAKI